MYFTVLNSDFFLAIKHEESVSVTSTTLCYLPLLLPPALISFPGEAQGIMHMPPEVPLYIEI